MRVLEPVKEILYDLPDVRGGKTSPVKVEFGNDCIAIQPEGMGQADGNYAPILIERQEGKIRLIYWPDINSEEPTIVDMSGALESARRLVKDMYDGGICPDCNEPIPDDACIGGQCANCSHVWNPVRENDDGL